MPVVAAAVCPHPPLMVPDLGAGAAGELDGLRTACDEAVRRLLAAAPDTVVVAGAGPDQWYGSVEFGGVGHYGRGGGSDLPLAVLLGAWLLDRAGTSVPRRGRGVPPEAPVTRCLAIGSELAGSEQRIGLLVMGDGSARRTPKAPGYVHPEAATFDATVAAALATADTEALVKLDADLAAELMAAGRAAWQVLAGAAGDRSWRADLLYDAAPYGVGYFVVTWT